MRFDLCHAREIAENREKIWTFWKILAFREKFLPLGVVIRLTKW